MERKFDILIVDDDVNLASNLQDLLEAGGYGTAVAHDGETALALCCEKPFELALIDIKLPDISGIKLVEELSSLPPEREYIIITGYASLDSAIEAVRQRSILAYETKPLDMDRLLALLASTAESKWAQAALQKEREKAQRYLDIAGVILVAIGADQKVSLVNRKGCEILGCEEKDIIGKNWFDTFIPERVGEKVRAVFEELMAGKPGQFAYYENPVLTRSGEERIIAWYNTVLYDEEGKVSATLSSGEDITEHKCMEEALRQSEEFNASLCTNSPTPVLVLNDDASIRYVNPALERLTGFSSAELVGRKPPYLWWIEGIRKASDKSLLQAMRRKRSRYEQLFKRKDGEVFWVEITFKTVEVNGEFKYHLENWVDLTEEKRLRENLEFYISQVTVAREEERKLIARDIHDDSIQDLATLALNIDALSRDKERLPKDIKQRLGGLRIQTNDVLDGLRRLSHELRPAILDQVGLVPALEALIEEKNKEGLNTSLEIAGSEQRLASEIELGLFRITQEALRNIRKHSSATKAELRLRFTSTKVRLSVSDNGKGFELPQMLGDLAAEGKLGLIGMQERARLLGGKFTLKSRVGRGTTVVIELPDIG